MKYLDCTIRDGGYYNNWDFEDSVVEKYYRGMSMLSDIEYIEIGYLGLKSTSYKGRYFWLNSEKIRIARILSGKKVAALLDFKSYNPTDLRKIIELSKKLDLLRIAVRPDDLDETSALLKSLERENVPVALNVMYCSKWHSNELVIERLVKSSARVRFVYLVDSYGSLLPDDLENLLVLLKRKGVANIGFHAHDNLGLAFANVLVCQKNNVEIVDGTILGMGRGAGNLRTELFLSHINRSRNAKGTLLILAELLRDFEDLQSYYGWGNSFPYVVSGVYNLPQADIMDMIRSQLSYANVLDSLFDNVSVLKPSQVKVMNPKIYGNGIILVGGGSSAIRLKNEVLQLARKENFHLLFTSLKFWHAYKMTDQKSAILCGVEQYRNLESHNIDCPIIALEDNSVDVSSLSEYDLVSNVPFTLSGTGIALAKVRTLDNLKALFLVGYDGYDELDVNNRAKQVENEKNFDIYGSSIISLSKTTYKNIEERSIHEYL